MRDALSHTLRRARAIAALALALAAMAAGLACGAAPAAGASAQDVAAARVYLQANYEFVRAAYAKIPAMERVLHAIPARVAGECPGAAKGSPQNPQSTQLSNELIGEMVLSAGKLLRSDADSYLRAVSRLRWSGGAVEHAIRDYASQVRSMEALALPHLCQDVQTWAASGYTALSAATVAFSAAFMDSWVAPGLLPPSLARSETAAERPLIDRTVNLEDAFTEWETREETTWWDAMAALDLWP